MLLSVFTGVKLAPIHPDHPLLRRGDNMDDLSHPRLRQYAVQALGAGGGSIEILKAGAGHVLFTKLDVTSGLLNTSTWGIIGFTPSYSQSLMKNAILWTLAGQKD